MVGGLEPLGSAKAPLGLSDEIAKGGYEGIYLVQQARIIVMAGTI